jgi:hypothetical protein
VNFFTRTFEILFKKLNKGLKEEIEVDKNSEFIEGNNHNLYGTNNNENELGMAKKTVITRVLEVETSDAIVEFPQNRTLLVEQLTEEPPAKAEIVKGLRTMEDVFKHYKPSVKLEFEDASGQSKKETVHFNEVRDFEKDGLMKNSEFLKGLGAEKENYLKIEKQLRANKVLREAISDSESKASLINSLQALLKELQDAK